MAKKKIVAKKAPAPKKVMEEIVEAPVMEAFAEEVPEVVVEAPKAVKPKKAVAATPKFIY